MSLIINDWSKNFDEQPHRHPVTPHGGEWIRPTLISSNNVSFDTHMGQHPTASQSVRPFLHSLPVYLTHSAWLDRRTFITLRVHLYLQHVAAMQRVAQFVIVSHLSVRTALQPQPLNEVADITT